jgi:hypothetical protein
MEEPIIQYELLVDVNADNLSGRINHLLGLNQSWTPLGGVSVSSQDNGPAIFAQAMVRVGHRA